MAENSKIEWTDATWTPIRARNLATGKVGWHCEHATTGCEFCYSEGFNMRLGTGLPFKPGHRKDIEIFLDEEMLTAPLRWRKPRMIFVCSMTDAFADFVTDEWLDKMFAVMALCPQHTFQVLTKRANRMRAYLQGEVWGRIFEAAEVIAPDWQRNHHLGFLLSGFGDEPRAIPNVWLGTSCERQKEADERIPDLLATPAAVRFISAEPLLGPLDLRQYLDGHEEHGVDMSREVGSRVGACIGWTPPLDWVIVGGESGKGARPFPLHVADALVQQCKAAGVAVFVKQLGAKPWRDLGDGVSTRPIISHSKGGDINEFPFALRVRQMPNEQVTHA